MEHKLENETLTIFLEGELNSFNSEEVEKDIEGLISNNSFNAVILDMKKLTYISSAGIRIVMGLKKRFDNTSLINLNDDVYYIFEMVGLHTLISVSKA